MTNSSGSGVSPLDPSVQLASVVGKPAITPPLPGFPSSASSDYAKSLVNMIGTSGSGQQILSTQDAMNSGFGSGTSAVAAWNAMVTANNGNTAAATQQWQTLFSQTVTITKADAAAGQQSFEAVYDAYYPGSSSADFATAFQQFFNDTASSQGYFIPAQAITQWSTSLQQATSKQGATLSGLSASGHVTINQILACLLSLVQVLQATNIVQANALTLNAQIQQAYTNQINQLPTFATGDTSVLGKLGAGDATNMSIQTANQYVTNTRQALDQWRSVTGTQAQQIQTFMSQMNDSVTATLNMVNNFMQQAQEIYQKIQGY